MWHLLGYFSPAHEWSHLYKHAIGTLLKCGLSIAMWLEQRSCRLIRTIASSGCQIFLNIDWRSQATRKSRQYSEEGRKVDNKRPAHCGIVNKLEVLDEWAGPAWGIVASDEIFVLYLTALGSSTSTERCQSLWIGWRIRMVVWIPIERCLAKCDSRP